MNNKPKKEKSEKAPWILMAIQADLKGEKEPTALVRTPEGDKVVPLSETKGKVNLYEQLPEYKKKELIRKLYEDFRKWETEQKSNPDK